MLEVELKFPIDDPEAVATRLAELGAEALPAIDQSDAYFNHPQRDFARTDEALRIRTVTHDGVARSVVTYKGPKQGEIAKTRYELEAPLVDATADAWGEMLVRLGFHSVATVNKRREPFKVERRGRAFEVVLDQVEGLGAFAEIETLASKIEQSAAELAVTQLGEDLGLATSERRSYLEMLLAQ